MLGFTQLFHTIHAGDVLSCFMYLYICGYTHAWKFGWVFFTRLFPTGTLWSPNNGNCLDDEQCHLRTIHHKAVKYHKLSTTSGFEVSLPMKMLRFYVLQPLSTASGCTPPFMEVWNADRRIQGQYLDWSLGSASIWATFFCWISTRNHVFHIGDTCVCVYRIIVYNDIYDKYS